jgi:exopolysaccharide production protein ExoQ
VEPILAFTGCLGIVLCLLWLSRSIYPERGLALWIPQLWFLIAWSRMPSLWFGLGVGNSPEGLEEGSPVDRAILSALILIALAVVLRTPRQRIVAVAKLNPALVLLFLFAVASLSWSEFAFITAKRLVKEMGNILMILILVTDKQPKKAVLLVMGRCAYILIPFSVVLWKFFSQYGRIYHQRSGMLMIAGVTTGKNALGAICMISLLLCLWRVVSRGRDVESDFSRRALTLADIAVGATAGWLLIIVDSLTPLLLTLLCGLFLVGCEFSRTRRRWIGLLAPVGIVTLILITPALLVYGIKSDNEIKALEGHQETFWGRVAFWPELDKVAQASPLKGVGYGSFWLGTRIRKLWAEYWWNPTESHNGYVETYLELGAVGVLLLVWFLLAGSRNATREAVLNSSGWGGLRVTFLLVAAAYNITEAAFKGLHPVWLCLLVFGTCGLRLTREPTVPSKSREKWAAVPEQDHRGDLSGVGVPLSPARPRRGGHYRGPRRY